MSNKFKKVTVYDMALAREKRVEKQKTLLKKYALPLVCFTLNIPGEIKTNPLIRKGYEIGLNIIKASLKANNFKIIHIDEVHLFTGNEAILVVDGYGPLIKEKMLDIENIHPFGILFDIDVIDKNGKKIERSLFNAKERKCLICDKDAKVCASKRKHSAKELYKKVNSILKKEIFEITRDNIATNAIKSLIYELLATPKPGLVDRNNNGSHKDMDIFTFVNSSASLYSYFYDCFTIGYKARRKDPSYVLLLLRERGKRAEETMYEETLGVNTHKGAIFSLGIIIGTIGHLYYNGYITGDIFKQIQTMCKDIQKRDCDKLNKTSMTNGEKLYKNCNIKGVRGEAESGFATVRNIALPTFKDCLYKGYDINASLCITLLYIIKSIDDTVLISRSSVERSVEIKKEIGELLIKHPYPSLSEIEKLDKKFIEENLSSGGAADLLSVCYFLYLMENKIEVMPSESYL